MRILHLIDQFDYCDGCAKHLFLLAREQKQRGHDVRVLTGKGDATALLETEGIPCKVNSLLRHEERSIVRFVRLIGLLGIEARKCKPDIIHAHHYYLANAIHLNPFLKKAPLVQTVHGNILAEGHFKMEVADRIIAVSESTRSLIESRSSDASLRTSVVPNGSAFLPLDSEVTSTVAYDDLCKQRRRRFVVSFFGRLVEEKGVHVLLEAVEILKGKVPLLCVIVGKGIGENRMREQAHRRHLEVIFFGSIRTIKPVMEQCDIVTFPSLQPEGMPLTLIESGLLSKALVASSTDGVVELVEHESTGLLVKPGDPDSLSEAITRLYREPELRLRLGSALRHRVLKNHSVSVMTDGVDEVYQQVLHQKRV